MGKVILFIRVSSEQQSLGSQEDALHRAALADGYREEDLIVIGKKESAIKLDEDNRQGLIELKKHIAAGDVDVIYLFELSRLSRKPETLYSIRNQLLEAQVQLKCLNPSLTLLTPDRTQLDSAANVLFSLFGAFAEQEMIEKKERFRRGKRKKAEEGKYNGGAIPFGYKKNPEKDNLIVIDDEAAHLVREVFNLYESGISQPKLSKEYHRRGIKKLTTSFINNILNNERYTGRKRRYSGSSYERVYPVIIAPEQFDHCREIAKANNTTADKTRNIYYAHHLIVCTKCKRFFSASGSKVDYHCYDAFKYMHKYDNPKTPQCDLKMNISINIVDSLLWHLAQDAEVEYILHTAAKDKEMYKSKISILNQKIKTIELRLEDLDNKYDRVVEMYIEGGIGKDIRDKKFSAIAKDRKDIIMEQVSFENERDHLEALLAGLKERFNFNDVSEIASQMTRIITLKKNISSIVDDQLRSEIVHRHIQRMIIENRQITYEFSIGKRMAKARFITIWLYNGMVRNFYYLSNTGKGGIIINSDPEGNPKEKLSYEYLERFYDKTKRRLRREEREHNQTERASKYPEDKYILSYARLANFLNVKSLGTAYRWVEKLGVLKPAVVEYYKKEIVIDKIKCIALLKTEAKHNRWAKKILDNMDLDNI